MSWIPVLLSKGTFQTASWALIDTAAAVDVLPDSLGKRLGLDWEAALPLDPLTGSLGQHEVRGVLVDITIRLGAEEYNEQLGFAWVRSDVSPLLLGHRNFLAAFDVCIRRKEGVVEVTRPE